MDAFACQVAVFLFTIWYKYKIKTGNEPTESEKSNEEGDWTKPLSISLKQTSKIYYC